MKKTLIAVCSLLVAVGAYAQGTVNFATRNPGGLGVTAPVTLSNGTVATGPQYVAVLLAGATAGALTPQGTAPSPFRTGALAGYITGGSTTITGIPAGGAATVQVLAYDSTLFASPAAALAAGEGATGTGRSGLITLTKTGDPTAAPPGTPVDLVGFATFSINVGAVPEPGTMALAIAGGLGLLLFRRRK